MILYRSIFLGGHCKSCLNGEARVYLFGFVYRHDLVLYMCIKLQVHTYDSILTETHGENEKSWFSRLNDASMLRKLCRLVTRKLGSYIRLEASKEEENKGAEGHRFFGARVVFYGWLSESMKSIQSAFWYPVRKILVCYVCLSFCSPLNISILGIPNVWLKKTVTCETRTIEESRGQGVQHVQ